MQNEWNQKDDGHFFKFSLVLRKHCVALGRAGKKTNSLSLKKARKKDSF